MNRLLACLLVCAPLLCAQSVPQSQESEQWRSLSFLEGTWDAKTNGTASSGADASGTYTFRKDLSGHILTRYSGRSGCKAPADFDCNHSDLLHVYQERPGEPLRAIYFDNEGHVIHYSISTPSATSAIFISDPGVPGPRFRLVYELKNDIMQGKFQMQMPGKTEWTSYLEWSGGRR
jgi:hypothetical protein